MASQSLRALEARGLLSARRVGRRVQYRLTLATTGVASVLVPALRSAFQHTASPVDSIFRLATAFTHPRQIEFFRELKAQAHAFGEMQAHLRISMPALCRHLAKLERRGFVLLDQAGRYVAIDPPDGVGRALARLVE